MKTVNTLELLNISCHLTCLDMCEGMWVSGCDYRYGCESEGGVSGCECGCVWVGGWVGVTVGVSVGVCESVSTRLNVRGCMWKCECKSEYGYECGCVLYVWVCVNCSRFGAFSSAEWELVQWTVRKTTDILGPFYHTRNNFTQLQLHILPSSKSKPWQSNHRGLIYGIHFLFQETKQQRKGN